VKPNRAPLLALLSLVFALGCKDEAPAPPPSPPVQPKQRPAILGPRPTSSRAAFDLALGADGAVLVWGAPRRDGGGIRAARVDALGTRVGEDARVYDPRLLRSSGATSAPPSTVELAASSAGGKVAVVWAEQDGPEVAIRSAVGDVAAGTFGEARLLERGPLARADARGRVGVTSSPDGSFLGLYRGGERACEEGGRARCVGFGVRSLGADGDEGRVPMAVRGPCDRAVAALSSLGDRFYYGVCAEAEGGRATTVYTIQLEPQYARSERVLAGCDPLGSTVVGGAVWVAGRCAGARRIARFEAERDRASEIALGDGAVRCDGDRPVLDLAEGVAVPLDAPMDRLEPLLPPSLTEGGARAVWTGEALLVAASLGQDVALHRYQCEYGDLVRTDVL
jgi:hypothetical protein